MMQRRKRRAAVLVAVALLATAVAVWYGHTYWQIAVDGATASAMSVKPEAEPKLGKNVIGDPYRYFASYRFVDAFGREHASRQSISRDQYEALSQGDVWLRVHYSRARQYQRSTPQPWSFVAGAGDVFGVAAAIGVDALGGQFQNAV
jgi:hypothetical protein